jgi:acyl carrier protein
MAIREQVVNLLHANFPPISQIRLEDNESFLEHGVIDSIGMLELVALLNRDFKINISDDELIPENLDSIASVCAFLRRKGIES